MVEENSLLAPLAVADTSFYPEFSPVLMIEYEAFDG